MRRSFFSVLVASLAFVISAPVSWAQSWSGKCIGVSDEDTITVLRDREQVKIRLQGINCQQKKQPVWNRALRVSSDILLAKPADKQRVNTDRHACKAVLRLRVFSECVSSSSPCQDKFKELIQQRSTSLSVSAHRC